MLSPASRARTSGFDPHHGGRRGRRVAGKDEDSGGARDLQATGCGGRVSQLLDQGKLGIRKFRLRGLARAATEALWGVLTYDVMQWMRLSWIPKRRVTAAA